MVQNWCNRRGLPFNPIKNKIVLFTRKKDLKDITKLTHFDKNLQLSTEVKYLGITLDKKLT